MGCFDENTVAAFVAGELDQVSASALEAHFDSCHRCFALVAASAKAVSTAAPALASGPVVESSDGAPGLDVLCRGTRVGRYEVTSLVGAGAMGRVYAAIDSELGRTIALKLVRAGRGAEADRRLLREARTMAKLTHPNVVTVHDVGMFGEHVFLAMELIEGETLRTWLTESRRTRSVLTTFLAAGRGLAAAHAAGVVHRDFKPDNVLVGRGDRVVVTDFGLARDTSDEGEEPHLLAGTPVYMAPEQLRREQIDARADQFSFCIALHEGLTGERPYRGKHTAELLAAISGQAFVDARGAPKHVQRAIRRGLSASPEDRFASMDELLAALARDPTATRRKVAIGALAGVTLVVAGSRMTTSRTERPSCRDEVPGKLEAVWGAPQRASVRAAFLATGIANAAAAATRVDNAIDTYGARWTAMHVEACDATHERHEQPSELLDRRVGCLAERLGDLRTLIDVLVHADADVVNNAVNAVDGLGALDQCDALALGADRAMSTAQREKVAALRADLSRAQLLRAAGRVTDSLALAKAAAQASDELDDPSLAALARLRIGQAESAAGDAASASITLRRAAELADIAKEDALRAEALTSRLFVEGTTLRNGALIAELDGAAAAVIARMGDGWMSAGLEGARLHALGNALVTKGSLTGDTATQEQGAATLEKAAALREAVHGMRSPEVATTRNSLCAAKGMLFAYESALEQCQRAADIWVDRLGPTHPHLSKAYTNLGNVLESLERFDEALAQYEHAATVAHALGEEHHLYWSALSNLAAALSRRGDYDRAISLHLRVVELQERVPALPGFSRENVLTNLGIAYQRKGDAGRARDAFERALALASQTTDVSTWQALRLNLASVLWADGKAASRRRARELVTAGRDALAADAPDRGSYDAWLATYR